MTQPVMHRPAPVWLNDLQKAKAEGGTGFKPKITVQDLLERINDPTAPEQQLIPTSPRSIEACFRLGIDPVDLQYHPPIWYKRKEDADEEVGRLRYERNEAVRQDRIRALIDTRKHLIDDGWQPGDASVAAKQAALKRQDSSGGHGGSAMVEKERQRLEVLKRRQERELQQMVQHEVTRKELLDRQEKRVQEMDRRAAELAKQKIEAEAARMAKQREIELQKAREEKELERKARLMAEERYRHERKMQQEAAERERERKRQAFLEDMERRRKAEEARKETEAILAAQAEEVRQRKEEMAKKDVERAKRMEEEAKARAATNQEKRKKAELRISSALASNADLLQRKRSAFQQREAEAAQRKRELEVIHAKEEEHRREEEIRKQKERQDKYAAAVQSEEARKQALKARAEEKDRMLSELYAQRKKERDLRKVEQEFSLKLRLDKVDSIQKTSLYQRQMLLERIMGDYDRTRSLMRERQELQEARKAANMSASLQRHALAQAMDNLRVSKGMNKLASSGGHVNINDLLNRARPATAN